MCNIYEIGRLQVRRVRVNNFIAKFSRVLVLLTLLPLAFGSCQKVDVPKGTPRCIKKLIKEASCVKEVYKYQYAGEEVYLFVADGCPDYPTDLYSEKCQRICRFGGLGGETGVGCPNFYSEATDQELVWSQ